jgi:hypothetical protein
MLVALATVLGAKLAGAMLHTDQSRLADDVSLGIQKWRQRDGWHG